jgi:DNA polymerase-3 subunit alpha
LEKLKKIAIEKSKDNKKYIKRLNIEFEEIDKAGLWNYFKEIIKSNKKFHNTNNLLCAYLWGICPENPIDKDEELKWYYSNEYPDIDVDFSPESRDKIKEFCAKEFGENNVVSIANYNHFGIKSGIRDISRVLEIPLEEVNECTTKLNDDVNDMKWEDAIKTYPVLEQFEKEHPKVCELVKQFNGKVRSIGKHAGGLVISSCDLTKTIPLITRENPESDKKFILSSFSEGQNRSDLKTMGLIKQDILGLDNLNYISTCLKYMEQRGKYDPKKGIFRTKEDGENWEDESYLNDPESIKVANNADLQLVFQFDSDGIRKLVKKTGVNNFYDLVVFNALYRPGPLNCLEENTKILTNNGYVEIKLLSNKHNKIAYIDNNGNIKYTSKFIVKKKNKTKKILKISTSENEILSSLDHKFLNKDNKFIEAKRLKINDEIKTI